MALTIKRNTGNFTCRRGNPPLSRFRRCGFSPFAAALRGEKIDETARRELWEETGAADFSLRRVCAYSVRDGGEETFGMLYAAEIFSFGPLPETEIGRAALFSELPEAWTYPLIQPRLFDRVCLEPARGAGEKA